MGNTTSACDTRTRTTSPIALLITLFAAAAVAGGCNTTPKVAYQFDSKTDFATLKTYAVEPTNSPVLDLRMLNGKPMKETIQQSIEQALQARGLRPATAAAPDILVRWTASMQYEQVSGDMGTPGVNIEPDDPDTGAILDSGGGEGVPSQLAEGGIKIDLISTQAKHVVWRGIVAAVLRSDQPDPKRVARLNAALAELFANYPPPAAAAR